MFSIGGTVDLDVSGQGTVPRIIISMAGFVWADPRPRNKHHSQHTAGDDKTLPAIGRPLPTILGRDRHAVGYGRPGPRTGFPAHLHRSGDLGS